MIAKRRVGGFQSPKTFKPAGQLDRQIPPLAHTSMYIWHKFWGRKTWNVVAEYIKNYSPEGGIVFDPFAGSGVAAMEALKAGRRAIVCDLLPVSAELIRLTIEPVDLIKLRQAYDRVEKQVKNRIGRLYETRCRKCGYRFPFDCAIWDGAECVEVRYQSCPKCGDRREKGCKLDRSDKLLLRAIDRSRIKAWYPRNKLYYPDGAPFMKKEHYESLDQMFTKRNLVALALLMEAIEKEPSRQLRDFLKIGFTSMVHLGSKMVAISNPSATSHHTSFSSTGWTQHSYWSAPRFMEQNVWDKFESAVTGHQGLLKAKEESNRYYADVTIADRVEEVLEGSADIYIHCGDSLDFMRNTTKRHGSFADYIFTDPPYDAAVQYGELAYLWVAWLKKDSGYLESLQTKEVIRNERQHKDFGIYHSFLRDSFRLAYDILKPGRYMSLTFHNPTFQVRNATLHAGVIAGFNFEKIHHQPLGQKSAKAMLQPFGSAQGDFYIRFLKPEGGSAKYGPERIDEVRFERIVLEATVRVLAERGEPTPYTILINAIDPDLARNGYFSELNTGLNVDDVLKRHLGGELVLVSIRLGGKEGKAWWFKDPSAVKHLVTIPLSERVEQTVLRKLQERVRMTFTDMWSAISEVFPNSLTSDVTSIREALQEYAREAGRKGEWMLKPEFGRDRMKRMHTRMIGILAEAGKTQGYDVWIGRPEQGDAMAEGFPDRKGELRQYVSLPSLKGIENAGDNAGEVERIDVLWIKGKRIHSVFEVESTTCMTEALKRGSNIESRVPKYLVMPQDREDQLQRKLRSPMFGAQFEKDSWKCLYFEALDMAFQKKSGKLDVDSLINKKIRVSYSTRPKAGRQLNLLADNSGEQDDEEEES